MISSHYALRTTQYSLCITYYPPLPTHCSLLTTHRSLLTTLYMHSCLPTSAQEQSGRHQRRWRPPWQQSYPPVQAAAVTARHAPGMRLGEVGVQHMAALFAGSTQAVSRLVWIKGGHGLEACLDQGRVTACLEQGRVLRGADPQEAARSGDGTSYRWHELQAARSADSTIWSTGGSNI